MNFDFLAFIVNCVAHWTEGNMNYLIGRISAGQSQKPTYKCIAYTESSSNSQSNPNDPFSNLKNRQTRQQIIENLNPDIVDLYSYNANDNLLDSSKSTIQLSVSQDEFCRNIDNIIDEQFSFNFLKVHGSRNHVAPPSISNEGRRFKRDLNMSSYAILPKPTHHHTCKFPKWLNKKWHNLKQSKLFTIDYKQDSLLVYDQKNSIIINKYTCSHMKVRKGNYVQAVVKSLNGW